MLTKLDLLIIINYYYYCNYHYFYCYCYIVIVIVVVVVVVIVIIHAFRLGHVDLSTIRPISLTFKLTLNKTKAKLCNLACGCLAL